MRSLYSLDVLSERYEAIICDEGQDFREEFWMPLELLLADYDRSPLYVFFDDNQNIYERASTFPIRGEPVFADNELPEHGADSYGCVHALSGCAGLPTRERRRRGPIRSGASAGLRKPEKSTLGSSTSSLIKPFLPATLPFSSWMRGARQPAMRPCGACHCRNRRHGSWKAFETTAQS